MKFRFALLLTLASFSIAGQSEETATYMAELKKIDSKSISITEKCYEMFVYTQQELRDDNFEAMFKFIDKVEEYVTQQPSDINKLYLNAMKGYHYSNMQMYGDAIRYDLIAIGLAESLKDTGIAPVVTSVYNTVGISYSKRGQNAKAASYFDKALRLAEKSKRKNAIAIYSNNLGLEYSSLNQHLKARAYMKRAAKLLKQVGLDSYLPTAHLNIGTTFQGEKEYDSAMYYYRKAYSQAKHSADSLDPHMISLCLCNISEILLFQGKKDSSLLMNLKAFDMCDTVNDRYQMINVLLLFSNIYSKRKEFEKAHHFLREYMRVKEHLFTQEEIQKTTDAELAQQSISRQIETKLLRKNIEISKLALARNQLFSWGIAIVSIIIFVLLFVTFMRFREKKKANVILGEQKTAIEAQQKEITDSINYAKRIQHALLPPAEILQQRFASHFVIYLPKHIVGGDFYYAETVDEHTIWITVIDCTGHGVPGGFMSVMAHSALTKSITDEKLTSPATVLTRMSALVTAMLSKQQTQTLRDGMDMTLCKITRKGSSIQLQVAAANNPLWIVRKNGTVEEISATRQHVGYSEEKKPFEEHTLALEKGDKLYLFTDGYADQFGGNEGKKYKYKKLKNLIVAASSKSMVDQASIFEKEFHAWKGDNEQMDDVCLMGIEV
ncbi:MAG: SpoIIE family protein phosphatase [Flavobacteriales bacterium]